MLVSKSDLLQFGAQVRAERERLGVSQEELADRAGLHRTYLGGVERGERNLGLLNIIRIAKALGLSPARLFDASQRRPPGVSFKEPRE